VSKDYFYYRNKKIEEIVRGTKVKKKLKFINKWLIDITEVLKNVLVFAIICGLLFNDPFGIINTISNLISGVGDQGIAGFISLAILILIYRR
tara:strand:- start:2139 stop:2414 length:276 start_codon:yes stop_codon:yes gene_type:complete